MDKIELPNQLVAILADPLLQKLLVLRPDANSDRRIANWLNAVLEDVVQGDADQDTLWEVLEVLKQYVEQTKVKCYRANILRTH
jgi:centromere protein I